LAQALALPRRIHDLGTMTMSTPLHLALAALAGVSAAPLDDAVLNLPGYGMPPSAQWSGFLNASAAEPGTMLHYWYAQVEAPAEPAEAPVVLWLNGGPGSSSILGMMQEQGPLLINATGGLMRNPYAWTKQANLLILESPGGVGYSYCAAMKTGGNCANTDISTAAAARAALQDFFTSKFPELRSNSFFITGESYAGVYIPTLTEEILLHAPEINIKGIAVGDPCTDVKSQSESMDMLWYSHKNGFVPDDDFDFLWNTCNYRRPSFLARGSWLREASGWAAAPPLVKASSPPLDATTAAKCQTAFRRYLATTSKGMSQEWPHAYINNLDLFTDASALDWSLPGTENYYQAQWMNSPEVKKALHLESSPAAQWPGPSEGWKYTSSYAACNADAPEGTESMIDFYRRIAPKLDTTIVFNGDVDPCVSYEGTRVAIQKIGFAVLAGGAYRPWFFDKKGASIETFMEKPSLFGPDLELRDAGAQFGGHVVDYENSLSFATVHGSGHMVPQFRPQAAEMLLHRLLSGSSFSPLLPTDEELGSMTQAQFDAAVDDWTQAAKDYATAVSPPPAAHGVFVV